MHSATPVRRSSRWWRWITDASSGHILFRPVTIRAGEKRITGMGLAPMTVLHKCQRQGIDSALVNRGLFLLPARQCPFVIVLGHLAYYPRLGFVPASVHGLVCQWEGIPDEAFMIRVFDQDCMKGIQGIARFRDEFDEAM